MSMPCELPAHLPVVQVRLRRIYPDQDHLVEVEDRAALAEEPLEVQVADVPGVVVARYDHDVLALDAVDKLGGLFELLPVAGVGEVAGDHDHGRVHPVYLDDRPVEEIGYEPRVAAVDVRDLAYGQTTFSVHSLPRL